MKKFLVLLTLVSVVSLSAIENSFTELLQNGDSDFQADVDPICLREQAISAKVEVMNLTFNESLNCVRPTACDDTSAPKCQGLNSGSNCGNGGKCVAAPQCYCNDK